MVISFRLVKKNVTLPSKWCDLLRYVYIFHNRNYPPYSEEGGRYDPALFYTLKPGASRFEAPEFSTILQTNSAGFRDDEASLNYPELIFLGDSYTMGWGVGQEESFAELLENAMKVKGLNLGIPSYGTARELLSLQKTTLDSCRLVVLQFCTNDSEENRQFIANNLQLNISSEASYRQHRRLNLLYQCYYPLKYVQGVLWLLEKKITVHYYAEDLEKMPESASPQNIEDFFTIVAELKKVFGGNILLFHLGVGTATAEVTQQWQSWLAKHPLEGVYVFPAYQFLLPEDYFLLDTHINIYGHQKLAAALEKYIAEKGLLR